MDAAARQALRSKQRTRRAGEAHAGRGIELVEMRRRARGKAMVRTFLPLHSFAAFTVVLQGGRLSVVAFLTFLVRRLFTSSFDLRPL